MFFDSVSYPEHRGANKELAGIQISGLHILALHHPSLRLVLAQHGSVQVQKFLTILIVHLAQWKLDAWYIIM